MKGSPDPQSGATEGWRWFVLSDLGNDSVLSGLYLNKVTLAALRYLPRWIKKLLLAL